MPPTLRDALDAVAAGQTVAGHDAALVVLEAATNGLEERFAAIRILALATDHSRAGLYLEAAEAKPG